MSIKDIYKVLPIESKETYPWLLKKHYAHRIPNIIYSFGLYKGGLPKGIITFGMPPLTNVLFICDDIKMNDILELNRLCINDDLERNVLSYFVSQSLKLLPKNKILLSYADQNKGHHGYIYQATNWLYTGEGSIGTCEYVLNEREIHSRHLNKKEFFEPRQLYYDNSLTCNQNFLNIGGKIIKNKPKYRYIFINGDEKFKKSIMKKLKLQCLPYPKGDNKRYDSSYKPETQQILF